MADLVNNIALDTDVERAESMPARRPAEQRDLYQMIAARPDHGVIGSSGGQSITNVAFLARVAAWRTCLHHAVGTRFALYCEDSIEFSAALLGAWGAGKTIWLSADILPASIAALSTCVDGFLGEFPATCHPLQLRPDALGDTSPWQHVHPDFAALVVFTSGTTGQAQPIPKRLSQLMSEVQTLEALFGARLGAVDVIATVSHQHIYGLLFKVLWPLSAGRPMHPRRQNFPEELTRSLAARDCVLISSPAHLKRLPQHPGWSAARDRLRAIFCSGGPLAPEDAAHCAAMLGRTPIEVYGSSETGGIAWRQRSHPDDAAWQPLPSVSWRLATASDQLEVRSPHLADDGWLQLADRIQVAAAGGFVLLGRSDRIVKIEEKRVSLDAIEQALLRSDLVDAVRVVACEEGTRQRVGQPASRRDAKRQRLAAFVVTTDSGNALLVSKGKAALNRHLLALLSDVVPAIGWPRRWRYLAHFPLDAQGKISRSALLALLDARPLLPHVRLVESHAQRVTMELTIPADLLYLEGHFPAKPVLAGVVQIEWAIHYGQVHFLLPPCFRALHSVKFQRLILADAPVSLELIYDGLKHCLYFRYFSVDGPHSSGRVLFGMAVDKAIDV